MRVSRFFPVRYNPPMNITEEIDRMKKEPGFKENVGMILTHNGVVRGWSRDDRRTSSAEWLPAPQLRLQGAGNAQGRKVITIAG